MKTLSLDDEMYDALVACMSHLKADEELAEDQGIEQDVLDRLYEMFDQ